MENPDNLENFRKELEDIVDKARRREMTGNVFGRLKEFSLQTLKGEGRLGQILEGAVVSGLARATGTPVIIGIPPLLRVCLEDSVNPIIMAYNWKNYATYAVGAALPYADKIYTAAQNYLN